MDLNKVFPFSAGVVLPAAGCGQRTKLRTPKQFCEVNGRPLICFTIACFHRLPWVQRIVIPTSAQHLELLRQLISQYCFDKVTVVEGGSTRHRSICAGIKALQKVDPSIEVVVIHDAVRPFVSSDILGNIAAAAHKHGAAGVCRPLVSTVIARDGDHRLTESLDRSQYSNSEMPQAFQVPVIAKAYSQCTSDDLDFGTECLLLALKYSGVHAHILDGTDDLWKVTYKKDLLAAEAVLKERLTRVGIINRGSWPELADSITARLSALSLQVGEQLNPESGAGEATSSTDTANTFIVLHSPFTASVCSIIPGQDVNRCSEAVARHSDANRDLEQRITTTAAAESTENDANILMSDDGNTDEKALNGLTDCDGWQSNRLQATLMSIHREWVSLSSSDRLVDYTFVHVVVTSSQAEWIRLQADWSMALLAVSREYREKGVLVYGVLASKEASVDAVSEMMASVTQRGHSSFSGQLFLVA